MTFLVSVSAQVYHHERVSDALPPGEDNSDGVQNHILALIIIICTCLSF